MGCVRVISTVYLNCGFVSAKNKTAINDPSLNQCFKSICHNTTTATFIIHSFYIRTSDFGADAERSLRFEAKKVLETFLSRTSYKSKLDYKLRCSP